MIEKNIREKVITAMRERDFDTKSILKVILAEVDTVKSRDKSNPEFLEDTKIVKIIEKAIKSNQETISHSDNEKQVKTLEKEIVIMSNFVPKKISSEELKILIKGLSIEEENIGKKTGLVIKELKKKGVNFDPSEVNKILKSDK